MCSSDLLFLKGRPGFKHLPNDRAQGRHGHGSSRPAKGWPLDGIAHGLEGAASAGALSKSLRFWLASASDSVLGSSSGNSMVT